MNQGNRASETQRSAAHRTASSGTGAKRAREDDAWHMRLTREAGSVVEGCLCDDAGERHHCQAAVLCEKMWS